jgi:hypothetical protein
MKKYMLSLAAAFTALTSPVSASDKVYHYFCKGQSTPANAENERRRYAVKVTETVQTGRSPKSGSIAVRAYDWSDKNAAFQIGREKIERFRIIKVSPDCAKYGWEAENSQYHALMCTATQGVADLRIFDKSSRQLLFEADCDQADVD